MEKDELKLVLEKHVKWLRDEKGGERANLIRANLSDAELSGANLRDADLSYADLSYADLRGANLICANLSYADLSYADLRGANLIRANLSDADLRYANLICANLSYADLRGSDLSDADLRNALITCKYENYKLNKCIQISNIGSRNDTTYFFITNDNKILVRCGCFYDTIAEFKKAVKKTHAGTIYEKQYNYAIKIAETHT